MSGVKVRFIDDVEPRRIERDQELFADSLVGGHLADDGPFNTTDRLSRQNASSGG
jgi:hypothetical protein